MDELLKTIQHGMRACGKHPAAYCPTTHHNMEEMKDIADNKPGFIRRDVVRLPDAEGQVKGAGRRYIQMYAVQTGEAC